ncbi:IQ motif and SEC7 domain-containing protein 3-like [Gorilla gorilla gorilla]|uniref:IQ motif and SEC7 domain-containing protein 3-like n=1 Tax=Gorilla gorilla gorilla TaxID=9595 RepID=UPI002445B6B1|nr:IQ motif and SEC7 domain-containing protein 3-like isoform X2 [Gorilla gorilla gorilla]
MESLLENPVRAVLYLKELTAIVQNQQSLIHTQRERIDELERRLDELSAENRSLWEHQQLLQAQPPPGLVPPVIGPAAGRSGHRSCRRQGLGTSPGPQGQRSAAAPHPAPDQPPLQHHGQLLEQSQRGPGSRAHTPQSPHKHLGTQGAVTDKEKERPPSCCAAAGALLQHKSPSALGKGVLSRRPECPGSLAHMEDISWTPLLASSPAPVHLMMLRGMWEARHPYLASNDLQILLLLP